MDTSDARPNFVASITHRLPAAARAALTTSASGRRASWPGVERQPGRRHERRVEVELVQELDRPAAAIMRMCWSSSPGQTTTCIGSAIAL